jgi:hypothetical protein
MYKLVFFVPESHLDTVKKAVFEVGAGQVGRYDRCCWQVLGDGQFRPLSGSSPFQGEENLLERVREYRVELVCQDELISSAVRALVEAHPYEEPAYDVSLLVDILY